MILIINGPNLNMLGRRDAAVYGSQTLADIERMISGAFPGIEFEFFQSNSEGAIIDCLQRWAYSPKCEGVVINPGAYAHYSYAIADALRDCTVKSVEVHLSNIHAREEFRRHSVTAEAADACIAGCGAKGYLLAVEALIDTQK